MQHLFAKSVACNESSNIIFSYINIVAFETIVKTSVEMQSTRKLIGQRSVHGRCAKLVPNVKKVHSCEHKNSNEIYKYGLRKENRGEIDQGNEEKGNKTKSRRRVNPTPIWKFGR